MTIRRQTVYRDRFVVWSKKLKEGQGIAGLTAKQQVKKEGYEIVGKLEEKITMQEVTSDSSVRVTDHVILQEFRRDGPMISLSVEQQEPKVREVYSEAINDLPSIPGKNPNLQRRLRYSPTKES